MLVTNSEILYSNYWEHYKFAKELSMFLPANHPKRVGIEKEMNKMMAKLKIESE